MAKVPVPCGVARVDEQRVPLVQGLGQGFRLHERRDEGEDCGALPERARPHALGHWRGILAGAAEVEPAGAGAGSRRITQQYLYFNALRLRWGMPVSWLSM